jgi:hypothetical protein
MVHAQSANQKIFPSDYVTRRGFLGGGADQPPGDNPKDNPNDNPKDNPKDNPEGRSRALRSHAPRWCYRARARRERAAIFSGSGVVWQVTVGTGG